MFLEDLNKIENVLNVLFEKKEVKSIPSEFIRKRIVIEIDNFQAVCRDYDFDDSCDLFQSKPFDEYTEEDLVSAIELTRDMAKKFFECGRLTLVDQGEVGLFIDFINDTFSLD